MTVGHRAGRRAGALARATISLGTALSVLGVAIVALLDPPYIHAVLDAAGSARILGLDQQATYAVSDRTIHELVFGPATFAFRVPAGGPRFYDAAEASHLHAASNLLHAFLVVAGLGVLALVVGLVRYRRDEGAWQAVRGGALWFAVAFAVVGLFFAVAFNTAFTLFHEIFFPEGNWEFNPATAKMVQLYPTPFWEIISMTLAALVLVLCAAAWLLATARLRRIERAFMAEPATTERHGGSAGEAGR